MTTVAIKPSGNTTTDTNAILKAIRAGSNVQLGDGVYFLNQTVRFTASGQTIRGVNPWATTIEWAGEGDAPVFEVVDHQYVSIERMMIRPFGWAQDTQNRSITGYAISISRDAATPAYTLINNVFLHSMHNGININGATETRLNRINLRSLTGAAGITYAGQGKGDAGSYRCVIDDLVAANDSDLVNNTINWIVFDSYAYSLVINKAALMNGAHGVLMQNSAGNDGYPMWIFANDLECDHNSKDAIRLDGGEGCQIVNSWLGSSMGGAGLFAGPSWRGDLSLSNSRVYGNARVGVDLAAGSGAVLNGNLIGDNGVIAPGTYSGICIGWNTRGVTVTGNRIGDLVGVAGNSQLHGILVDQGAKDFVISSNVVNGNQGRGIKDATWFWTPKHVFGNVT